MLHIVFSVSSGFLRLRNMLQGLAHAILTFRNLQTISSRRIPTLPPPPPIHLLDPPPLGLSHEFRIPYPTADLILTERQPLITTVPIPGYESPLAAMMPNNLLDLVPIFLMLVIISGFLFLFPGLVHIFATISKSLTVFVNGPTNFLNSFKRKSLAIACPSWYMSFRTLISLFSVILFWTGPPEIATVLAIVWIMSKVLSLEETPNMITIFLKRCGLLTELDSRTPETLNMIYEQISRGTVVPSDLVWLMTQPDGRHHEPAQLIADLYVGYSHLQVELEERERELEQVLALKEKQEKEARHDKLEAENHQLRVQQIHAKFVDSENSLRHRLEASRTREEKLQVDLLAASQERDSLMEFVSTLQASAKKREDLIAAAEARHEDAEKATVNLRIRLADALNGVRHALEQRDRQAKLASEKECLVQSTAEELRVALAKLTDAEDEITRLHARIRRERDRQVREMKELLDEQARMQDRHEADVHQMSRQAQDAQVQLNGLYEILSRIDSGSQSSFGELRLPRHRPRTRATESRGTGQPPESLDISTPPISPAFQSTSSRFFTNFSLLLPRQDRRDPSISQAPELHHISTWFEEVSGAARAQHAAMEDLLERMCQLEFEHAQEVESSELEKSHLLDELAVTREQLRLTQEEICQLRRDLDREKEMRRDVETHIEHELDMCQAKLEAVQDARRTGRIKFIEAIELLRLRSADAESLKVEAEDTRFRCEQVTFLSAALQERVTDLEAELRTLKSARLCSTPTQATIRSPFIRPADTGLSCADIPTVDSIYMTIPSSLSYLLDLSLPFSSSQSTDISLYIPHTEAAPPPSMDTDSDDQEDLSVCLELSMTRDPWPLSPLCDISSSRALALSPAGNSSVSVDWPPTGPALLPADDVSREGDETGIQAEEDTVNSLLIAWKSSPNESSADNNLGCWRTMSPMISSTSRRHQLRHRPLSGYHSDSKLFFSLSDNSYDASSSRPSAPFPIFPSLSISYSLARVLDKDLVTTEDYLDSLSLTRSDDASPDSHASFLSQRDRGDVSNVSTSSFPQQPHIRLPPVRLPSQDFELAQVVGSEISPAPIHQEHQEATRTRSQRQNAMLVTRYDTGDSVDHMVFTMAHTKSLSSPQIDPNNQTTMSFVPELPPALPSVEIVPPSRNAVINFLPSHQLLDSITICESTGDFEDSLRVSQGPRKNRNSDCYPIHPRPLDIPKLNYGLQNGFVPCSRPIASEGPSGDFNDFESIIPLDCPTSTPVASRKRVLERQWLSPDAARVALPTHSPSLDEIARLLSTKRVYLEPFGF